MTQGQSQVGLNIKLVAVGLGGAATNVCNLNYFHPIINDEKNSIVSHSISVDCWACGLELNAMQTRVK